jgi:site-specific recombinase XerD
MKIERQKYTLNVHTAKQALTRYMTRFEGYCGSLKSTHLSSINKFLSFTEKNGRSEHDHVVFTDSEIMRWVDQISKARINSDTAASKILCAEHFLEMLVHEQIISHNPIKSVRDHFGRRGWIGIVWALRSHSPETALELLRIPPLFSGEFGALAESYIKLQQSIGKHYDKKIVLAQFNRFLNSRSVETIHDVTKSLVRDWINTMSCNRNSCKRKLHILKQFFDYSCDLEAAHRNPVSDFLIDSFGYSTKPFKPYIYTHNEVTQLLTGAQKLTANPMFTLKPQTLHMITILLYALGLRIGEALRLTIMDVDLCQKTLFVRNSKFYKDRIIPFGPKLGDHLRNYLSLRCKLFKSVKLDEPLFITRRCAFIRNRTIQYVFLDVLKAAEIAVPPGQRRPHLHDLRHTFAVHRLLRWYKEGVDVQDKLPLLSTFMGHIDIYSSQVYLTITDDILREANDRFYSQFGTFLGKEILP